MNKQKLQSAVLAFIKNKKANIAYNSDNWAERRERKAYYQSFTKAKLLAMTEDSFVEYLSRLWSMLMWGNKRFLANKLIADNKGFDKIKMQLAELLYDSIPIEKRWHNFLKSVKGIGPSTMSELLSYSNPDEYVVVNKTVVSCLAYLCIQDMPRHNYQYTGKKYVEICAIAKEIAVALKEAGDGDADLLEVDYFLWDEVLPLVEKQESVSQTPAADKPKTQTDSKSLHDEIKEKLVAIGELLGFESRSEVPIAAGAKVDVVWEAKIGNMGKAIYVFEVQSKGSIDSLILNLTRALSNAAVQAVVAVADEEQLSKIIRESQGVIDRRSLRTWNSNDVIVVYDSLARAHESINELRLVPNSF